MLMARIRDRSPSPDNTDQAVLIKRLKTSHVSPVPPPAPAAPDHINTTALIVSDDPTHHFANDLFDHNNVARLNQDYTESAPFKYALVEKLFQDELLRKVKDECLSELNFTEKETDIYKVNQTGDLASLNFLDSSQIARLPSLLALRDALYSPQFRAFLRAVTGCGPLSGQKQDMSVNSYTRGCHLLNHDDVIGSRRVSYILYMPLPHYQLWQKDWGGALELYPTRINDDGLPEPECVPEKCIPPSWNQFIFFEVQPGKSFHSVEEVAVGGGQDGRARLSISGWFHSAQEGEEGYVAESAPEAKSSREQLTSSSTIFKPYPSTDPEILPDLSLSEDHVAFLAEFLNPVYLQPRTMKALAQRFVEESSLELHSFLNAPLAEALEPRLRDLDARDGLGEERPRRIPPHTAGSTAGWALKGPPHKWRYCILRPHEGSGPRESVIPRAHASSAEVIMRSLQEELFPSPAFRAWLSIVSRLMPMRYAVEARRFRPGLDYTLATSEEREARLDVVLGLTPPVRETESEDEGDRFKRRREREVRGWAVAEWGGWECYMAPHNEEDDPAIYRSSTHKKAKGAPPSNSAANGHTSSGNGAEASSSSKPSASASASTSTSKINGHSHPDPDHENDADVEDLPTHPDLEAEIDADVDDEAPEPAPESVDDPMEQDNDDEEEDSTLLTVQPGYNRLLLVLRDERVMRFVKYVSGAAEGSRWDVCGEYEVGIVQDLGEEEEL